jgi:effector-binding domain-containing protein
VTLAAAPVAIEYARRVSASYTVTTRTASPRPIAAVRARCAIGDIPRAFKTSLDQVWAFLRSHSELPRGHNVFLYHHLSRQGDAIDIDFGVEVHGPFTPEGAVTPTQTPSGEVATVVHRGPYDRLGAAHDAIHAWCAANQRAIGACSWEIYGDWTDDPAKLETTIEYLLR